jgi:hypothetical protein
VIEEVNERVDIRVRIVIEILVAEIFSNFDSTDFFFIVIEEPLSDLLCALITHVLNESHFQHIFNPLVLGRRDLIWVWVIE